MEATPEWNIEYFRATVASGTVLVLKCNLTTTDLTLRA